MSSAGSTPQQNLAASVVLIPAWQPEPGVVDLTVALVEAGFGHIFIVDDGSGPDFRAIFDTLALEPSVTVVRHAANLGKGRALKSGINHFLNADQSWQQLITADADGQHLPADIVRVATAAVGASTAVLGVRQFANDVPLRSRSAISLPGASSPLSRAPPLLIRRPDSVPFRAPCCRSCLPFRANGTSTK